jgi:hypothetical protein
MEEFVDRYTNIMMAGPNYRFFCPSNQKHPPFVLNTRIYSCNLIRNNCPFRWRGKYNEDTILSLDILKAGYCTVQFNAFLQSKLGTQTLAGGNTNEFYHKEFSDDPMNEKIGPYKIKGTINKSEMLVNVHPDVSRVVWKFNRWHHYVDYTSFKKNELEIRPDVDLSRMPVVDEFGMKFVNSSKTA